MKIRRTLSNRLAKKLQGYIESNDLVEEVVPNEVIWETKIKFTEEIEAIIALYNSEGGPIIDATLYVDGSSEDSLDCFTLLGEYPFHYDGKSYIAVLQTKNNAERFIDKL